MQLCQDQSAPNPFQSMHLFFFFLPNGTDCYFWLSNPSWVFSLSWGTASPVTLVGMDVAVSSSSVYTCLQRRALGVAMLAPPPVTPHLPLLTPESYFLMWAAHPKATVGWESFLTGTSDGAKSHFPHTKVCSGIHPAWSSHFISETVNNTAGNSWRRKEQFDSFTNKLLTFSQSVSYILFFALITRMTFWAFGTPPVSVYTFILQLFSEINESSRASCMS